MSPVHFWFFINCQRWIHTIRYIHPQSPNDLFPHPLFLGDGDNGFEPPLIVPDYFLEGNAAFDGLRGLMPSVYFVFPFFAHRLFEYVRHFAAQPSAGSFTAYYFSHEPTWKIPDDVQPEKPLSQPHQILKRHWRWEEVLTMLNESQRPPKTDVEDIPYMRQYDRCHSRDARIVAYFERFARMAIAWGGNA